MAHEITAADRFVENRANGRAWHGLGKDLAEFGALGATVRESFRAAGLDWDTELVSVQYRANGGWMDAPDNRAHVRCDTRELLGIVGKDYKPVPNAVLASFTDALQVEGATLETAGSLRGGKRVWALLKLGTAQQVTDGRGDVMMDYLLITNAHDGTGAFRAYYTRVRVVCANTYRMAETRAGSAGFWHRHDGDVQAKTGEAKRVLGLISKQVEQANVEAFTMARKHLTEPSGYFAGVYEATFGKRPEPRKLTDEDQAAIGAAMLASVFETPAETLDAAIADYDHKRGAVVAQWTENFVNDPAYGTAWGVLNAVTQYHDHQRGRGDPREREMTEARVHSNLFGASATDKQVAYRMALELSQTQD